MVGGDDETLKLSVQFLKHPSPLELPPHACEHIQVHHDGYQDTRSVHDVQVSMRSNLPPRIAFSGLTGSIAIFIEPREWCVHLTSTLKH